MAHSLDRALARSVHESIKTRNVSAVDGAFKNFGQLGMTAGVSGFIHQQVLLRHIGDVGRRFILRQEVIVRLVLPRSPVRRNGQPPVLAVVKCGIDIEDDASKRMESVADNLTDFELSRSNLGHDLVL